MTKLVLSLILHWCGEAACYWFQWSWPNFHSYKSRTWCFNVALLWTFQQRICACLRSEWCSGGVLGGLGYTGSPGSARSSRIRSVCPHGRVTYLGWNFNCTE